MTETHSTQAPIESFVDLHVYVGPGLIPRQYTAEEFVDSEQGELAGMGLWNHFYSTTPLIESVDYPDDLTMVGGVVLNRYVGGLNPDAIEAAASISDERIVVCFPTVHAENFLAKSPYELPPEWGADSSRPSEEVNGVPVTARNGELTDSAEETLHAVADHDCILETGYLSSEETATLTRRALEIGIDGITLTNPIYQLIDMPIEVQSNLAEHDGVYVEHNYAMGYINEIPLEKTVRQINAVGAENCIICSDMGQVHNPSPSEGLAAFSEQLLSHDITMDELVSMGRENPRQLLGAD